MRKTKTEVKQTASTESVRPRPGTGAMYQMIPVELLAPTAENPRRFRKGDRGLAELAESIKQQGVLQPLLVRPSTPNGTYEIRCGERRWRAAQMAGLVDVPCIVREMTDEQAFDATMTENLQREDIHPLEEAEGYCLYTERGWSQEQIAEHLGKSVRYVRRRSALVGLAPIWRDCALDESHDVSRWPVGHLEHLAALPESSQVAVYERLDMNALHYYSPWTINTGQLRGLIADATHTLDHARWDLADADLVPESGACVGCRRRSDCDPALWDALESEERPEPEEPTCRICGCVEGNACVDEESDSPCSWVEESSRTLWWLCSACVEKTQAGARCLDGACWAAKSEAHVKRLLDVERSKHERVVAVLDGVLMEREIESFSALGETVRSYAIEPAKKSDPGAFRVVYATGKKAGQTGYARETSYGPSRGKAGKAKSAAVPLAERKEKYRRLRAKIVVERVLGILEPLAEAVHENSIDCDFVPPMSDEQKLGFAAVMGFSRGDWHNFMPAGTAYDAWPRYDALLTRDLSWLVNRVFQAAVGSVCGDLLALKYANQFQVRQMDGLTRLCGLLGLDYELFMREAEAAKPYPKSWKNLKANGTPKDETKTAAKKPARKGKRK